MPSNRVPRVRLKQALSYGLYGVLCVGALGAGAAAGWVGQSKVGTAYARQTLLNVKPADVFETTDGVNLLILGCDADVSPGGKKVLRKQARSDTMIVARLDFKNSRISGIGIPRDLLVELPGYRAQKINGYHSIGGPELARQAAETVLGVKIDRTLTIDYDSFQDMVDMVGGVEVFVPKRMKYTDRRANPPLNIDFKPGRQLMNGYDAMCFVRFRHSDDTFHRQERQVDFMLSFKDAVKKKPQLLNQLADQAMHVLGDGFTSEEMAAIARFAQSLPREAIAFGSVPVVPASNYNLKLDEAKLPEVLSEFNLVETPAVVSQRS